MDRGKGLPTSRSSKTKIGAPHHGSELYALGTKGSSSRDDKSKVMSSVKSASERKREATPLGGSSSKKPKLSSSSSSSTSVGGPSRSSGSGIGDGSSTSSIGSTSVNSTPTVVVEPWEQLALECTDPLELLYSIKVAYDQQNTDTIIGLVCGAVKSLSSSSTTRSKNENNTLVISLLYLCKELPSIFHNDIITSAFVCILKRDSQHAFKGRNNQYAHVVATNLLVRAYYDKKNWPEIFLRIYIDDASGERVWVDNPDCAPFVENICTAFGTHIPPKSMLQPELLSGERGGGASSSSSSGGGRDSTTITIDDDSNDNSMHSNSETFRSELLFDCPVQERYTNSMHIVEKYVLDTVKDQFNRRQQQDCSTRNFLKFLSTTCGIPDIRTLSVSRLELWIHNQKLMKPAQELLTYICYNITGQTHKDNEVLASLVKMRLKSKPLINTYMTCLKEMINLQPSILYTTLKYVVQNELSNARNPNNMGMLANMFQSKPEQSAKHLAEIYQEFLLQREDCLRTLRVFLRELVKMLRYEINLMEFCKAFLIIRQELQQQIQQFELKERYFQQMIDIICLCMFLLISPQIREINVSSRAGRDMRNNSTLITFYNQIGQIHLDSLTWMHEVVPHLFRPQSTEYSQALHKILLLDTPEQYSKCDQWPPEPERALLLRLISETPVHQDSILRIILIGITKDIPFNVPETIDVIEQTVKRASSLKSDYPAVEATKLEIIDFLFSMAEYHHPENIVLPMSYEPPKLAISVYYWKVWNILLILSAHNPSTFGSFCWEQYPMLRQLMEMCITNQFHDIKALEDDSQIVALEKTQILEFESHLAAATSKIIITEQTSLLLSQLMLMDPMGVARRPPNHMLEQLQQLNTSHKLGHLLCRSRKPDLLLEIIQRHGTTQSMPWLADLVQNSDGDFNHLPVQCLCEFLLSNSANINPENSRDAELLDYLRKLLQDSSCERQTACEVLEYFLRRLASTSKQSRILAIQGLKLLLQPPTTTQQQQQQQHYSNNDKENQTSSDWLLLYLPQIPHFMHARPLIIAQLRAACQIENDPELVMIYIQFIAAHTLHDPVPDMLEHVMDMAQLIVERSTIFQHIIPHTSNNIIPTNQTTPADVILNESRLQTLNCLFVMFNNYLIKLREHKSPYEWTDYPDLLMVHFEDGIQLPIHLNIIHAFVILLTHSSISLPNSIPILDYWFPPSRHIPQAFTVDTNEPVPLLPDWLKLKMIRSPVDRLVEAAMYDLTPDQIVLFVQNFGTPINSMSKLLALLDHAVMEQFEAVKNAVLNKAYLAQLIEIQQTRGAKNGHITMQALELNLHSGAPPPMHHHSHHPQPLDFCSSVQQQSLIQPQNHHQIKPPSTIPILKQTINVLDSINLDQFQTIFSTTNEPTLSYSSTVSSTKNPHEVEEIIDLLLKTSSLNKLNTIRFRRLIGQLIGHNKMQMIQRPISQQQQHLQITECKDYIANKACIYLMELTKTPSGIYFFQHIFQPTHLLTFFRALFIRVPENIENYNLMFEILERILQIMLQLPTFIVQTLLRIRRTFVKQVLSKRQLNEIDTEGFLKLLLSIDLHELEKKGKKFIHYMIKQRKTENVIDAILTAFNSPVIKSEDNPMVNETLIMLFNNKQGILIDWLTQIDTEMITVNEQKQIDLLFNMKRTYRNEFRYYMLSILCHQTNWSELNITINEILNEFKKNYDPTAVLNFIEALQQHPKLWQGRDKSQPKHQQQFELLLQLNETQINVYLEYVLNEIIYNYENNMILPTSTSSSSSSPSMSSSSTISISSGFSQQKKTISEKLNSRLNLLFEIIDTEYFDLRQVIQFVRSYRCNEQLKFQFLQQLYLLEPSIKFIDDELTDVYQANTLSIKACNSDIITNYIITTIAGPSHIATTQSQSQKDQSIANDTELLIRKLAASHPLLFLRQLSVLASLLQGKTHMSLNVLRSEYHLHRFIQILRVLEILQPFIFDDAYKSGLQTALDCYFTLFKYHIRAKEVHSIIFRFVEFLQSYININITSSLIFIEQYSDLLQELASRYHNYAPLHQLVQGLSLMKHKKINSDLTQDDIKQEFDLNKQQSSNNTIQTMDIDETSSVSNTLGNTISQLDIESRGAASFVLSGTSYNHQSKLLHQIAPHFNTLINIIQNSNSEEIILQPLNEIDNFTLKRCGYLDELFNRLLELIFSPSEKIRSKSYILLIRHLKYHPGNNDTNRSALNAYLQCLSDSNSTVTTSALNYLVEMVICLQEYATEILNTVFELGISSRLNPTSQIKKCIQILKLQHAC